MFSSTSVKSTSLSFVFMFLGGICLSDGLFLTCVEDAYEYDMKTILCQTSNTTECFLQSNCSDPYVAIKYRFNVTISEVTSTNCSSLENKCFDALVRKNKTFGLYNNQNCVFDIANRTNSTTNIIIPSDFSEFLGHFKSFIADYTYDNIMYVENSSDLGCFNSTTSRNETLANITGHNVNNRTNYWNNSFFMFPTKSQSSLLSLSMVGGETKYTDGAHILEKALQLLKEFVSTNITSLALMSLNLSAQNILEWKTNNTNDTIFGVFDTEPLDHLDLRSNNLSTLPTKLLELKNLTYLDISSNTYLMSNSVIALDHNSSKLFNLLDLNLSGVHLKRLSFFKIFISSANGSRISTLNMSSCELVMDMEDADVFAGLNELNTLDLSSNKISTIPEKIFNPLKNIQYLNLSNNILTVFKNVMFDDSVSIREVDLSKNYIKTFGSIAGAGEIISLNLACNLIDQWTSEDIFYSSINVDKTWVSNVDFSHNRIGVINDAMGTSLGILQSVVLESNSFDCDDCHLNEFINWIRQINRNILKVEVILNNNSDMQQFTCSSPPSLLGKNIVDLNSTSKSCKEVNNTSNSIEANIYTVGVPIIGGFLLICVVMIILAHKYRFEISYIKYYWKMKRRKNGKDSSDSIEFEFDAFLSYSRQDRTWVTEYLLAKLENSDEKYHLCLHERDFHLGSLILENIEDSMRKSRFTIMVLSKGFVLSQWCRWELEMAYYKLFEDRREFLILIEKERLDRSDIPRHLKYLIDTRTYLEWPEPGQTSSSSQEKVLWRRLKKALGESLYQKTLKDEEHKSKELEADRIKNQFKYDILRSELNNNNKVYTSMSADVSLC